jgi:hypothetical protein
MSSASRAVSMEPSSAASGKPADEGANETLRRHSRAGELAFPTAEARDSALSKSGGPSLGEPLADSLPPTWSSSSDLCLSKSWPQVPPGPGRRRAGIRYAFRRVLQFPQERQGQGGLGVAPARE